MIIDCPYCNKLYITSNSASCKDDAHDFFHSNYADTWYLKLNFLNAAIGYTGKYYYVGTIATNGHIDFSFKIEKVLLEECYKTLLRYKKLNAFT